MSPRRVGRIAAYGLMIGASALWVVPLLFALYISFRPYSETSQYGYVSLPHTLTLSNYLNAWTQADLPRFFINSVEITVPAVILTLFLASMVAFVVVRVNIRINVALLLLFTAGNLLPQQVIITPLYRLYLLIPLPGFLSSSGLLYDSIAGLVVINVAFQTGFCVFVLSNYMRTIPGEMYEAAQVDGASMWARYLADYLDIQRLFLGDHPHGDRQQTPDHLRARQPAGTVRLQPEPDRRGRGDGGDPDTGRVHPAAEAVHRRADPRRDEGLVSWCYWMLPEN
jgi:ABC-type maltose transport system permease subunit